MIILNQSTQRDAGEVILLRGRTEEDIYSCVKRVRQDSPTTLYRGVVGFDPKASSETIAKTICNDQELYRKETGIRIRMKNVIMSPSDLNKGKEFEEACRILDGFAVYYANEGFPTVYNLWKNKEGDYIGTIVFGSVSPADGHKYHYNKESVREREQEALDTVAYNVTGKNRPKALFDFRKQIYY